MADTEIRLPGIPAGLTVSMRVRDPDTLAILETVALSESNNYYTGDVTGPHAGTFIFETLISGTVAGAASGEIDDDAGPYVIVDGHVRPTKGIHTVQVTITDGQDPDLPVQNAYVEIREGSSGANWHSAYTNASGQLPEPLKLKAATYIIEAIKDDHVSLSTTLVVDSDESPAYEMAPNSPPPAGNPGYATGKLTCRTWGAGGIELATSITLTATMTGVKSGAQGTLWLTFAREITSDGTTAIAVIPDMPHGSTWKLTAGDDDIVSSGGAQLITAGGEVEVTVPDTGTEFDIADFIGEVAAPSE